MVLLFITMWTWSFISKNKMGYIQLSQLTSTLESILGTVSNNVYFLTCILKDMAPDVRFEMENVKRLWWILYRRWKRESYCFARKVL